MLYPVASASAVTFQSGNGLTLTAADEIDGRLWALTFTTSALPQPVHVDVLLPSDYDTNTTTSYPVLYLLDGTVGTRRTGPVSARQTQQLACR